MSAAASGACVTIVEWNPDERIEFVSPAPSAYLHWIAACWGVPPGIVLALASLLLPLPWAWLVAPVAFLAPCMFTMWVDRRFFRRREFVLDMNAARISWRIGRKRGSAKLTDIESIDLRVLLLRTTFHPQSNVAKHLFAGRLAIRTVQRTLVVCYSFEEMRGEEAEPFAELLELQSRLVTALDDVSSKHVAYRGGGVRWGIERLSMPWFEQVS